MIVRKHYMTRPDGVDLYITYSDSGVKIRQEQTGAVYDSAVDVESVLYTYTETDEPVEEPVDPTPPDDEIDDHEALNILLGRSDDDEPSDDPEAS